MKGETCKKCGTYYDDPSEGFYWETRKHGWRKPCKKCIATYNKRPDQKKKRNEANIRYRTTEKGKHTLKKIKDNQTKKYWDDKRRKNG